MQYLHCVVEFQLRKLSCALTWYENAVPQLRCASTESKSSLRKLRCTSKIKKINMIIIIIIFIYLPSDVISQEKKLQLPLDLSPKHRNMRFL